MLVQEDGKADPHKIAALPKSESEAVRFLFALHLLTLSPQGGSEMSYTTIRLILDIIGACILILGEMRTTGTHINQWC